MCQQIEQLHQSGTAFDFALMTGDIAFSGKTEEYTLAENFFTHLEQASGIPIESMYCVPGRRYLSVSYMPLRCHNASLTVVVRYEVA